MGEEWYGAHPGSVELRMVLVGTLDCGKTLTADNLLGQKGFFSSSSSSSSSSRSCILRRGLSLSRRLTLIEAPRWYWSAGHLESSVQEETKQALSLAAPGPHAFLLLIPVNQFTEMERRVPLELEKVFGQGVLQHTMVVLTCGDYLLGRTAEEYLAKEDQGLRDVIRLCEGRYHVMNNRQPENREQVKELLTKVEWMVQQKGGCYVEGVPLPGAQLPSMSSPLSEVEMVETVQSVNAERPQSSLGLGTNPRESVQRTVIDRAVILRSEKQRVESERLGRETEERERVERERCERAVQEELEREREDSLRKILAERTEEREREKREKKQHEKAEMERAARERIFQEREREEKERKERERLKNEREVERLTIQAEIDRIKKERAEREKREKREREEKERLEKEREEKRLKMQSEIDRIEKDRAERERILKEREKRSQVEREREEKARAEEQLLEKEIDRRKREGTEKEQYEKSEIEGKEREREEIERILKEREEMEGREGIQRSGARRETIEERRERLRRARFERERLEQEMAEREREESLRKENDRTETQRLEQEKREKERIEKEKEFDQERLEKEKEKQRIEEKEKAQRASAEKERMESAEKERLEREKAEKERAEKERMERQRTEKERLERERREKERTEKEKAEKERLEREREKERMERERAEREKQVKEEQAPIKQLTNGLHSQMLPQKQQLFEQQHSSEDKQQKTKGSPKPDADGAILSQLTGPGNQKNFKYVYHRDPTGENLSLSALELRLVLLGCTGSGKSAAGNVILGRKEFESRADPAVTQRCEKGRAIVGIRQVAVVDTPDWFFSKDSPEQVRSQLSSCVALSTPGPHAFLFCVPLHRTPDSAQLQALGALEGVFGPGAVTSNTLLLFTHSDCLENRLKGGKGLDAVEEYIATKRPDLLKLVEKCGDRYHILERARHEGGEDGGDGVEMRSVAMLIEKVQQIVTDRGGGHYSCPLYQEAEERVRDRHEELLQARGERRRGGGGGGGGQLDTLEEEEEDQVIEVKRTRDEAEKSVKLESVPALILPPPEPSFLRIVGQKVAAGLATGTKVVASGLFAGAKKVPKPLAGGAVLGAGLGVFFGGLFGGALGGAGGVALAEMARRKLRSRRTDSDEQRETDKKES